MWGKGGRGRDVHSVFLCDGADVVGSGDGTCDGSLLLVVGEALSGEEGGASLGDLNDDGGLDVAGVENEGREDLRYDRGRTERPRERSWQRRKR